MTIEQCFNKYIIYYIMKKNLLLLLMLFAFSQYGLVNAQTNIVVVMNDGTENSMEVSAAGKIFFENSTLFIDDGASNTVSFSISNIQKIYFDAYSKLESYSFEGEKVMLYPNPAQDFFSIATNLSDPFPISIFSIDGKLIQSYVSSNQENIDISNLKSGFYIVRVNNVSIKLCKL